MIGKLRGFFGAGIPTLVEGAGHRQPDLVEKTERRDGRGNRQDAIQVSRRYAQIRAGDEKLTADTARIRGERRIMDGSSIQSYREAVYCNASYRQKVANWDDLVKELEDRGLYQAALSYYPLCEMAKSPDD